MLALCQHNTLACYAFYYAGIFDAGQVTIDLIKLTLFMLISMKSLTCILFQVFTNPTTQALMSTIFSLKATYKLMYTFNVFEQF